MAYEAHTSFSWALPLDEPLIINPRFLIKHQKKSRSHWRRRRRRSQRRSQRSQKRYQLRTKLRRKKRKKSKRQRNPKKRNQKKTKQKTKPRKPPKTRRKRQRKQPPKKMTAKRNLNPKNQRNPKGMRLPLKEHWKMQWVLCWVLSVNDDQSWNQASISLVDPSNRQFPRIQTDHQRFTTGYCELDQRWKEITFLWYNEGEGDFPAFFRC